VATRTRYLLTYDIREPRRLRRVHQVATDYGEPPQYSVFVCDLTDAELVGLRLALRHEMHLTTDSAALFDLGSATGRGVRCVELLGPAPELPTDGPTIW
jgi:CRISPR-associated protein Cas2